VPLRCRPLDQKCRQPALELRLPQCDLIGVDVELLRSTGANGVITVTATNTVPSTTASCVVASTDFSALLEGGLKPERSAEAVRRVLPELRKLDRYERRFLVEEMSNHNL
jgi:hypothetical protein